jgi:transcriptional regulator with XRE-family HTH domain
MTVPPSGSSDAGGARLIRWAARRQINGSAATQGLGAGKAHKRQMSSRRHHGPMPVRQGPIDLGDGDARRLFSSCGADLRETRLALGRSQRSIARAAGLSPSRLGRIERGEVRSPSLPAICRVARVLGLSLSMRLYPAGSAVRDAGQLALEGRFESVLGSGLSFPREVVLPIADDPRAWDGAVVSSEGMAFVDAETRIGDVQTLARRLGTKLRDDPRSDILILAVARSAHNLRVLRDHREALRDLLPLDGAAIARALRAGRLPHASGIIVL